MYRGKEMNVKLWQKMKDLNYCTTAKSSKKNLIT